MWLDGYDLTGLTLIERKKILREILPEDDVLKYSDHIEKNGTRFYEEASANGLEGIIAKKAGSLYLPDSRSRDWVKIKTTKRQEVVIGGYTAARNSRSYFGALILGVYNNKGELEYAGHTGSGFNSKTLEDTWKKLQPLVTDKSPFTRKPKTNMPATWVKPKLLCEVKFQEWTNDGIMRQAIFLGLRTDKKATEVKRESAMGTKIIQERAKKTTGKKKTVSEILPAVKKPSVKKSKVKKAAVKVKSSSNGTSKTSAKQLLPEGEKDIVLKIDGKDLKFTNLDKLYWKKEKYTKRDMLNYYHRIAPYMLPYMLDRPQSLNRHPNGVGGMSFYQKDVEGKVPDWVVTHGDFSEANNEVIQYYVCHDEAHLLYLANLGCIEMNPWHSRAESPDNPDYCLIDLDPYQIGFNKVIETAQALKHILDELKIPGYPKTSGATGLHIYIPLGGKYHYDQSKQLAELIVTLLHNDIPAFTSLERSPAKRKRKVYLDYLQNRQGQTVAAPYSLRPKDGATVSTPLHWDEVKPGLTPEKFTIKNIFDRLKSEGDLFKPVLQRGIYIERVLRKIEAELHKI